MVLICVNDSSRARRIRTGPFTGGKTTTVRRNDRIFSNSECGRGKEWKHDRFTRRFSVRRFEFFFSNFHNARFIRSKISLSHRTRWFARRRDRQRRYTRVWFVIRSDSSVIYSVYRSGNNGLRTTRLPVKRVCDERKNKCTFGWRAAVESWKSDGSLDEWRFENHGDRGNVKEAQWKLDTGHASYSTCVF